MALWANLHGSCIDGRAELYGNRFLNGYLAAERGDEPALTELLAQCGITWTLLMPQRGAVSRLDGLPGWRRVYRPSFTCASRDRVRNGSFGEKRRRVRFGYADPRAIMPEIGISGECDRLSDQLTATGGGG